MSHSQSTGRIRPQKHGTLFHQSRPTPAIQSISKCLAFTGSGRIEPLSQVWIYWWPAGYFFFFYLAGKFKTRVLSNWSLTIAGLQPPYMSRTSVKLSHANTQKKKMKQIRHEWPFSVHRCYLSRSRGQGQRVMLLLHAVSTDDRVDGLLQCLQGGKGIPHRLKVQWQRWEK